MGSAVGDLLRARIEVRRIVLEPLLPRRSLVEDTLNLVPEPINLDAVRLVEES